MTLGESELQRIGDYVRGHLYAWLNDVAPQVIVAPQLLERTLRVEEELKNLRETMEARFAAQHAVMKAGFDTVNKQLETVDKRFEAQHAVMKAGFDAMDKRLETVDKRFEAQQAVADRRLETVDKRFEAQHAVMKAGFDAMDKRLETG
jgi:tetrahydromethanopterin S-methyltransferase subunit G